jgi:Amt family ammonium transporter
VIGLAIHKTLGFRVSREDELAGVDRTQHAETAYAFAELGFSRFSPFGHHVSPTHGLHAATAAHTVLPAQHEKEDSLV